MHPHNNAFQTGILLIAHAPFASAMKQCALHIFPEKKHTIAAYDIKNDQTPESGLAQGLVLVKQLNADQLLILTDIVGATPFNLAKKLAETIHSQESGIESVRLLSGANIPMLVRACTYSQEPIDKLVERAIEGGQQGIMSINL